MFEYGRFKKKQIFIFVKSYLERENLKKVNSFGSIDQNPFRNLFDMTKAKSNSFCELNLDDVWGHF